MSANTNGLVGRVLQDDQNFRVEIVDYEGKLALKKNTKPTTPESRMYRIKNDVYGMDFFKEMALQHPDFAVCVPEVYEFSDDYYIRQYIEAPPILNRDMTVEEARPRMAQLAKLLADIDRLEPYGEVKYKGSSNWRNLHPSIRRWVNENLADKLINKAQGERVIEITTDLKSFMQPRIAHGDMSAMSHAYLNNEGKIVLIDFENFSPEIARYYDVAWGYTRAWGLASSTDIAKNFLKDFLEQAEPIEHQTDQLMAVLIQRTVALQKDADTDIKKKGIDYRQKAKDLLALVMENDLELLHS